MPSPLILLSETGELGARSGATYNIRVIIMRMWVVGWHKDADLELDKLPIPERVAMLHAVDKLEALGPRLPYPHQSSIRGVQGLRELRPRGGRSRWRAFYQHQGDTFVIGAIGPEADVDPRGFDRAARDALIRLEGEQ